METCSCQYLLEIEKWQARAEEVEKYNTEMARVLSEGHHITDEQIDAAWAFVIDPPGYLSSDVKKAVEAALWAFDIKRCEGCGDKMGSSKFTPGPPGVMGLLEVPCPDCNGHGWVKHD